MKLRASWPCRRGRYLSTLGRVRTSLSMPSSKPPDSFFFFMKEAMADLDWPSCAMEKVPSLLRRITAGMEGKIRHASSSGEGRDHLDDLLGELLDEDEGANEDVRRLDILLHRREVLRVAKLLEEVAGNLEAHLVVGGVELVHGGGERGLVLGLEHDVHNLDHDAALRLGDDAAHLGSTLV